MIDAPQRAFLGHPRGLFYLAFTEIWERFSYYGMTALVVLYMINQLLLPGHVEQIAGFAGLRLTLESVAGPLSTQALAFQIFGLYAGFVYFTPVLGGLIADRWIGQRNAVVIGALLMSAGHLAMAFDRTFLVALLLLVIGSGLLKGNIASQVGSLYPVDAEAQRARGFLIFSTAINVGAVAGPVFCGWLGQVYGWHFGFGAAAILMLVGLATYLSGFRHLPARVERVRVDDVAGVIDWRVIALLVFVIALTVFPSIACFQRTNVLPVWIQDHVTSSIGGLSIPIAWYQSIPPLTSILSVTPILWLSSRGVFGNGDFAKISVGCWITVASNLVLVAATYASPGREISAAWPVIYCVGMGVGFVCYWPALLSLVSRTAPARVNATMMGIVYTSLFVANVIIGWMGGFYESMSATGFWALHAAVGAAGGFILLMLGRRLERALAPSVAAAPS